MAAGVAAGVAGSALAAGAAGTLAACAAGVVAMKVNARSKDAKARETHDSFL